jgi:hypothetical protein
MMSFFQVGESMTVAALYSMVIGLGVIGIMCVGLLAAILIRLKHIASSLQRPPLRETISRAA